MKKPTIDQMTAELLAKGKGKFLQESTEKRRMYHGSRHYPPGKMFHPEHRPSGEGIKEFKNGLRGMTFVSPDPKFSNMYAGDAKDSDFMSGAVYPVHVQVRKPFDFENADHLDVMTDELSKLSGKSPEIPAWINAGSEKIRKQLRSGNWDVIEDPLVMGIAKRLGFDGAYMNEQGVKNLGVFDPKRIKSAVGNRGTYDINDPDITKAKGGRVKEPKNTVKAYKLFRVHEKHPGKLFPLFVDANTPVEMNKWVDAKEGEMSNGKVKSKIGALAYRPGWHAGDFPVATHIGEKSHPSLTAPDQRPANHVWAEVEMPNDVDWQSVANQRGLNAQGKVVPVKAHITDQIPMGGHYRYKTNPNMTGSWLIGGSMKVNRVLTDREVDRINRGTGYSDLPRAEPLKKKTFGFAQGGAVAPDEWKAEEHVNHAPKISRKAVGGSQEFPLRVPADNADLAPEPKYPWLDKASKGVQAVHDFVSAPGGYSNPPAEMISNALGLPDVSKMLGNMAYDSQLTTEGSPYHKLMNMRPEVAGSALAVAPLVGPAIKYGSKAAKAIAPTVAEMAAELAERGGAPLRQFAVPNESKLSKEEYSRMMREKYAADNAARAAKKEAAPTVQEVKAPADNLGFYSGVEKAALNLQRKVGTGDDFIADLMKNPGVNDARISEMGLDALRGKTNVTADEVRQLAAKNKPQLSKSVRVEPSQTKIAALESEYDDLTRELHDLQGSGNSRAISRVESELERNRLEQKYIKDETPADFGPESKPDYNTPGGKNYREIRVKTPAFTPAMDKLATEYRTNDMKGWTVNKLTPRQGGVYQDPVQIVDAQGNVRGASNGKLTDEEFLSQYAKEHAERELRDSEVFRETVHHGDEKNVLFHLRVADHTDAQGKKGLLIDELQSDWHQQGKKKGYGPQYQDRYRAYYDTEQGPVDIAFGKTPEQLERMIKSAAWDTMPIEIKIEKTADKVSQGVPDAPFKENWYQLGLKRAIKEAADTGMDRVYLTTGKTQNERYNLSKQISQVEYNDRGALYAYDKEGQLVIHEKVPKDKLSDYLGEEAAKKLMSQAEEGGRRSLSGVDLDVGGAGMEQWYDKNYINWLKKYANEHGAEVGMTRLPAANAKKYDLSLNQIDKFSKDPEFAKILDEEFIKRTGAPRITGKIEPQEGGTYMVQWSDGTFSGGYSQQGAFNKMREGKNRPTDDVRAWNAALARSGGQEVYYLELTPKLKNSAKKGQQYKVGGIVRKAIGGITQGTNMQAPTLAQMRMQLNQRKNPDYIDTIGIDQAVDMDPKRYISPTPTQNNFMPVGGVSDSNGLPVGGIDQDNMQQGQQMMPQQPQQDQDLQPNPSPQGTPPSEQEGTPQQKMGNMLSLTPQGQAMQAMGPAQPPRMAAGGSTKGYVVHQPKKPHPEVGTRFTATPQGNLAKRKKFDIFAHEGKGSIVPIPYDATTRDNLVTSVSGHNLTEPLLTEAGFDYSLDKNNLKNKIGGASNLGIAARVQNRLEQAHKEHGTDVFMLPNTMSDDAENFSHHPAHIVLDLLKQRQLNKHTIQQLDDDLRSQFVPVKNKVTGKVVKTYPFKNFLGYSHPVMMEQIIKGGHDLESTPGDLRKVMMERLGQVNIQKLLDYNLGDLKASILDPDISTDPKGYMGHTFVKGKPGAALRPGKHTDYDTDYTGTNEGGLGNNRPIEILMPDRYEEVHKELSARPVKKPKNATEMRGQVIGALEKRKANIAQPINARVINNAGLYEQGLKNGEFDPKNLDSVLAYYKRKGGYKKGGKVSEKTQKDIMKFNVLSKKAK